MLKEAGLPVRKFHRLPASFATLSYASGTQLRTISEQLGHASLAVTDRIYTHLLDEVKTEAADKMEGVLQLALEK
jgi:integrase